jgi:hypothetical protein
MTGTGKKFSFWTWLNLTMGRKKKADGTEEYAPPYRRYLPQTDG